MKSLCILHQMNQRSSPPVHAGRTAFVDHVRCPAAQPQTAITV